MLELAAKNGFDVILTKDNGMPYEYTAAALPCSVIVLQAPSNALDDIKPLVPQILARLTTLAPKSIIHIG